MDNSLDQSGVAEQLLDWIPRLMRLISSEAQPAGGEAILTMTQLRALGLLMRGNRLPSELARELGITPATASEVVELLVRRGLVERGDHPGDRRLTPLRITTVGSATWRSARERAIGALNALLESLSPDQLASLEVGLGALVTSLREKQGKGSRSEVKA